MRGRAIGLGLLGLGAFLLTAALALPAFLAPTMVRLPLDQTASVTVSDPDATYLNRAELAEAEGPVIVNLEVRGDAGSPDASEDVAVWHSATAITDEDGELITDPTEVVNCLDRRTAEAVACDEATDEIEGLTLTFPFDTQKQDYQVWNGSAGKGITTEFTGEDEVNGVSVYRFEHTVPETVIDSTEVPASLVGGSGSEMVDAEVVYSSERVILVEPTSGKIVSSVEQPLIVLRGPDGTDDATVLDATLGPDEKGLETAANEAAETRGDIRLVTTVLPWSVGGLGLVLLVAGLVQFFRSRGTGNHRGQPAEPMPATVSAAS